MNITLTLARALDSDQAYSLTALQIAGILDLAGLLIAVWTIWSSIWLPLSGHLKRTFQLISFGTLAFALSHLLDSLLQGSRVLDYGHATVLHQGTVLFSMFFFVAGLAGLVDMLPTLSSARRSSTSPHIWPASVGLALMISVFSFIMYGASPEAETLVLIGLDGSIILIAILCAGLLLRARISGVIGRSLWLALVGLLIFSLAHPAQAWFYSQTPLAPGMVAIIHRLVVIPAFLLFALSVTSLARSIRRNSKVEAGAGTNAPEPQPVVTPTPASRRTPIEPPTLSTSAALHLWQQQHLARRTDASSPQPSASGHEQRPIQHQQEPQQRKPG